MDKIYRLFIEKKEGFNVEATSLLPDLIHLLEIKGVKKLLMLYRYDLPGFSEEQ